MWFTDAAKRDYFLLEILKMVSATIYVFDKECNVYGAFNRFSDRQQTYNMFILVGLIKKNIKLTT